MARAEEFPQLAAQGLTTSPILGDGNCLFNALSDQVYGDPSRHKEIRSVAIDYMRNHPNDFKPFITVDGERRNPKRKVTRSTSKIEAATKQQTERAWEEHLRKMNKGGIWGDHLEITAFTRAYDHDVQIFESDKTLYHRARDDKVVRPIAYIAYHTWQHYSSIRNIDGPTTGLPEIRPKLLSIEEDLDSGYLSSNAPSSRSYSRSGSSSIERDCDSDNDNGEVDGPNKRRDRRLSKASRASYKSSCLEDVIQVPIIEITTPESTSSFRLPPPSHSASQLKLPARSRLPLSSSEETDWVPSEGSDDESKPDSAGFSAASPSRIPVKTSHRITLRLRKPNARDRKDMKKVAQKRAHKERIRSREEPPIDQDQIVGMKTLYI